MCKMEGKEIKFVGEGGSTDELSRNRWVMKERWGL